MTLNILVVDDSAVMRTMIIRSLRIAGLDLGEVSQAANGKEALAVLDSKWVDLAIVDINMPVMNGEEVIDHIRASPTISDLPIVVVSTEGSTVRIDSLRKKGVEFVHKPFTPEGLRRTIVSMTGVTDEQCGGEGALPNNGCDF
jgi:two-component system chemotaxis response regulator CheY